MPADFGAEVIRIERHGGSEDRTLAPVTDAGEGALFLQLNRNKRSMTLDPRAPGADEILRRLVGLTDVVAANVTSDDDQMAVGLVTAKAFGGGRNVRTAAVTSPTGLT
jgi:crotonobetainyl-CoA:carnitine CoA-transferase CaiB-like acyl-CoA transferase